MGEFDKPVGGVLFCCAFEVCLDFWCWGIEGGPIGIRLEGVLVRVCWDLLVDQLWVNVVGWEDVEMERVIQGTSHAQPRYLQTMSARGQIQICLVQCNIFPVQAEAARP
jgi:hypothetical protein